MLKKLKKIYYGLRALSAEGKKPVGMSIDTTYRCNLRCKHCYFRPQGYNKELSIGEWVPILNGWRKKGVIHCTWVGGEPLLRKDLIEKCKNIFPFNWVVTNGTIPFPAWRDVQFFVSIDGPEKIHDSIRGRGIYKRVKQNIECGNQKVCIAQVISRLNYKYLEKFVKEWYGHPDIIGINFDFYTPQIGKKDRLWLNFKERDKVIEKLRDIKEKYGDFIFLNQSILDAMHSKNCSRVTSDCPLKISQICLDALGKRKLPCVMIGADCNRCGCISAFSWYSVFKKQDFSSMKAIAKLLK